MKQPNEPDYPVIVYLKEPEAHFVSLVKRGANRTPFHIAKQDKETEPMRIIQRIIAKQGTPPEAIRKAVGEEASAFLKLDAPIENGAFTVYDQHKADAFKADTLEVVSLTDDNSIICLCGEPVKKSEGFISKLLDRKEEQGGIEVPEDMKAVKADALKGDFEWILFDELHAMQDAISGILGQQSAEQTNKVALIRTICDNFLKSLDTAIQVTKSDVFLPPNKEADAQEEKTETEKAEEEKDMNLNLDGKDAKQPEETMKAEEARTEVKEEITKPQDVAPTDAEKAEGQEKSEKPVPLTDPVTQSILTSLDGLSKQFDALKSEVEALKKAPASVVQSHADNPATQKSEAKKSNVFAGVFGNFSRM